MHFRIVPIKRKVGYGYQAQVILPKSDYGKRLVTGLGTFDSADRAAVAAKIFIHWMTYYDPPNFLFLTAPDTKDAV